MRILILSLLLLVGCASSTSKSRPQTAREAETRLLRSESVERQDVDEPAGWYWLLTTAFGLLDAVGTSDNEFRLEDGRLECVRLLGVEGADAIVYSDTEPGGLTWDGEAQIIQVELEVDGRRLSQRARFVTWGPPVMYGEGDYFVLAQSAGYSADVRRLTFTARKFISPGRSGASAGSTRVAWWGTLESTRQQECRLMRMRIFDDKTPEWPAVLRVLEQAGSREDSDWSSRAGETAFRELGLAAE